MRFSQAAITLLSLAFALNQQRVLGDVSFQGGQCVDFADNGTWTKLPLNDDNSYPVDLPFAFEFYGGRTFMYINTNGNLSFETPYYSFSPVGFPSNEYQMIAPFWADVDTTVDGDIWYKAIGNDKFVVTWTEVGHFGGGTGLVNDFQVILSTGSDTDMGLGNNVCFCYGDMQWTGGSRIDAAFYGSPATVGVNAGTFAPEGTSFLIGQFDKPGDSYDGPNGLPDGIDYLDHKSYCFNLVETTNTGTFDSELSTPNVSPVPPPTGSNGDPHFKTWTGEHYEYHGQCDMVLAKDPHFADGLGLDIHIRTKLVRYWSYIKTAVIRIGTDILEVRGSEDVDDWESHYWINFEYQGELTEVGGFPVTNTAPASAYKRTYEIDLSSKYPGQSIVIQAYKEFVRVDVKNACEKAFGKTVGMLGEFSTGKTFARDGTTVLDDFTELGNEWQVLPAEPKLFHEIEAPQFPNKCIDPEDPRGERRRRLAESTVSEDQAEAACASLKDPLDRKDCIYDVLATQDLDMVGAF